jgi:hypothetical protein
MILVAVLARTWMITGFMAADVTLLIIYGLIGLRSLYYLFFGRTIVMLNSHGITLMRGNSTKCLPWPQVGALCVEERASELRMNITATSGAVWFKGNGKAFGGDDNLLECAKEITRLKHIYATQ